MNSYTQLLVRLHFLRKMNYQSFANHRIRGFRREIQIRYFRLNIGLFHLWDGRLNGFRFVMILFALAWTSTFCFCSFPVCHHFWIWAPWLFLLWGWHIWSRCIFHLIFVIRHLNLEILLCRTFVGSGLGMSMMMVVLVVFMAVSVLFVMMMFWQFARARAQQLDEAKVRLILFVHLDQSCCWDLLLLAAAISSCCFLGLLDFRLHHLHLGHMEIRIIQNYSISFLQSPQIMLNIPTQDFLAKIDVEIQCDALGLNLVYISERELVDSIAELLLVHSFCRSGLLQLLRVRCQISVACFLQPRIRISSCAGCGIIAQTESIGGQG